MATVNRKPLVVFVSGSPREHSNSLHCCRIIASLVEKAGIRTRLFDLRLLHFSGCQGCLRCNPTGKCTFDDDFANLLLPTIYDANALVLATPIYFGDVSWLMKAFLDRFRVDVKVEMGVHHITCTPRDRLGKKDALLIFCQGEPTDDHTLSARELLRRFVRKVLCGSVLAEIVVRGVAFAGQVVWEKKRLEVILRRVGLEGSAEEFWRRHRKTYAELEQAAKKLAAAVKKENPA